MVLAYYAVDFPLTDVVFCATMSNIPRGFIWPDLSLYQYCFYGLPEMLIR